MGYTNYWHQHNDISDESWKLIKGEYKDYIQQIAGKNIIDSSTEDEIIFNGSCETFVFSKYAKIKPDFEGQDPSFNCCKTRGDLYDIFVWYLLVYINKICPGISITRDM